jgi:medium-chain acyl-[acyl-carrier-protein] hydrolase
MRMFCFPYAGGGAATYRGWGASLPGDLEVCPVQLPGRETRLREAPFSDLTTMVRAVADGINPLLDLPFVFFGHSMGAIIAFELARLLRERRRPQPLHLFAAGRRAPELPSRTRPIYALPEPEFLEELRRLNGTPEEVLRNQDLMRLLLPILRADFAVNDTYEFTSSEPLAAGISALGGLGDEDVPREDLEGWRRHTLGRFDVQMFPGDHFFIHDDKRLVLGAVARDLADLSATAPPLQSW